MIIITGRKLVGEIGGHLVYTITDTQMIPILDQKYLDDNLLTPDVHSAEAKYKSRLQLIDLTKNFYFSYTFDLTHTLQQTMKAPHLSTYFPRSMFCWNNYLLSEFKKCLGFQANENPFPEENIFQSHFAGQLAKWEWILPVVHGYFEQVKLSICGRIIDFFLISRRSRLFAGTRYLKRGVNELGHSANEVETEQILFDRNNGFCLEGQFTSYVQLRASIPLCWSQESNAMVARPPIIIQKVDPLFQSTRKHFEGLFERYGAPCLVLNLVKQNEPRPRESKVGSPFGEAVEFINHFLPPDMKIDYFGWDFKRHSKSKTHSVVDELMVFAEWALHKTGIFHSFPRPDAIQCHLQNTSRLNPTKASIATYLDRITSLNIAHTQKGICRSNCIDSLDRTNVAQFCIGKCALGYQLFGMGLSSSPRLESDSPITKVLLDMYERMGDCLAMQYGGSQMHRQMRKDRQMTTMAPVLYRNQAPAKPKEMFVSLMRHLQNSFQDSDKQEAINLLLGCFVPLRPPQKSLTLTEVIHLHPHFGNIWDLESDYFLHNPLPHVNSFKLPLKTELLSHWWVAPCSRFDKSLCLRSRKIRAPTGVVVEASGIQDNFYFQERYNSSELTSFDELLHVDSIYLPRETVICPSHIPRPGGSVSKESTSNPMDAATPSRVFRLFTPRKITVDLSHVTPKTAPQKRAPPTLTLLQSMFPDRLNPFLGRLLDATFSFNDDPLLDFLTEFTGNKLSCSSKQFCLALPCPVELSNEYDSNLAQTLGEYIRIPEKIEIHPELDRQIIEVDLKDYRFEYRRFEESRRNSVSQAKKYSEYCSLFQ
jgi:hypothetical protein